MAKHRHHLNRKVRLHATGQWVVTIGKSLTKKNTLADKVWYFPPTLTEEEAKAKANAKAAEWERLRKTWDTAHRPYLEILKQPFHDVPHWQHSQSGEKRSKIDPEALAEIRREGKVDHAELAQAFGEFTFPELISEYMYASQSALRTGEIQNSTLGKLRSQMNCVAEFLPKDIPACRLEGHHFVEAKQNLLKKYKKRTVQNYLSAALMLLRWLFGSYGGSEGRVPLGVEQAMTVRGITPNSIRIYSNDELKAAIERTAGTICQLDLMLALNCGMYPADIGRLRLDELDLKQGEVFWDREKEPENNFRIHHVLWPETLRLVKKYLNDGRDPRSFLDHIADKPVTVNASDLAFLDKGRPRYTTKPSGSAYDLVGRRWGSTIEGVQLKHMRKTTSDQLALMLEERSSEEEARSAEDIRKKFLGQKTDSLVLMYRTFGKSAYKLMNKYLIKMGEHFRSSGVFEHVDRH